MQLECAAPIRLIAKRVIAKGLFALPDLLDSMIAERAARVRGMALVIAILIRRNRGTLDGNDNQTNGAYLISVAIFRLRVIHASGQLFVQSPYRTKAAL